METLPTYSRLGLQIATTFKLFLFRVACNHPPNPLGLLSDKQRIFSPGIFINWFCGMVEQQVVTLIQGSGYCVIRVSHVLTRSHVVQGSPVSSCFLNTHWKLDWLI